MANFILVQVVKNETTKQPFPQQTIKIYTVYKSERIDSLDETYMKDEANI